MSISKSKLICLLVAVASLVGMILLLATDFGGFWLTGYGAGERFSCLGCQYNTPSETDTAAMIIGAILLALQFVLAVNAVVPKPFLKKLPSMKIIPILAIVTIIMMIAGGAAFGSYYRNYEWWLAAGFYGGLFASIINMVLAIYSWRINE